LKPPERRQPTGRRARPEKTESRGHERETGRSIIPRDKRRRKMPAIIKRVAKNKYEDLLLSLSANIAQNAPETTSKKARNTEVRELFSNEPSKKLIPRIISKSPIIKTNFAAYFRANFDIIL